MGDIWACFKGEGIGKFLDIDYLTMFADYRIPQILLHFGAIRYSNALMTKLESGKSFYQLFSFFSLFYFFIAL